MSIEPFNEPGALLAVDARARVGECPIWDADRGRVVWLDIPAQTIHSFWPGSQATRAQPVPEVISAIALCTDGGLIGASPAGLVRIDEEAEGNPLTRIAAIPHRSPSLHMNDGKSDRAGRFWAGSVAVSAQDAGCAALHRLNGDGSVTTEIEGVTISNGLGWSPDLDSGALSDRRPFIEIDAADGAPDGLAVDVDGCVWVAVVHGGEVRRYSPTGDLVARITLPTSVVTSCCFGGPHLTELYITTSAEHVRSERRASEPLAGGLFVCEVGVPGVPVSAAVTSSLEPAATPHAAERARDTTRRSAPRAEPRG